MTFLTKTFRAGFLLINIVAFHASAGTLGSLVKDNSDSHRFCFSTQQDGTCEMSQKDAARYCERMGSHLPTAREFALYAATLGAKGLLEVKDYNTKKARGEDVQTYTLMNFANIDRNFDSFYFSSAGYSPTGEYNNNTLWTASALASYTPIQYFFIAYAGEYNALQGIANPVSCMSNL